MRIVFAESMFIQTAESIPIAIMTNANNAGMKRMLQIEQRNGADETEIQLWWNERRGIQTVI